MSDLKPIERGKTPDKTAVLYRFLDTDVLRGSCSGVCVVSYERSRCSATVRANVDFHYRAFAQSEKEQ